MARPARITDLAVHLSSEAKANSRPRILVMPAVFAVGGVERNTAAVMRQLSTEFRFVVVTNEPHSPDSGRLLDAIKPDAEAIFDLASVAPRSTHLTCLDSICKAFSPDLVWVCNGSVWFHQNIHELMRLFRRVPIVDQQVYDHNEGWINSLTSDYVDAVARIVAINTHIRDALVDRFGAADKIDLIRHAVDFDRLDHWQGEAGADLEYRDARRRRYVFIGRLVDQKRPLDFIEVAHMLQKSHPHMDFRLIGNGPMARACRDRITKLGVANIEHVTYVENTAAVYRMADGLVIVSSYEGLPLVVLEALGSGVPVLATDVGEISALVDDVGDACVIVDGGIGNPATVSASLARFDEALDLHRSAAQRASSRVRERFGAAGVAETYVECWSRAWSTYADRDLRAW